MVIMPSYGLGLRPAFCSCSPYPRTSVEVASVMRVTLGIPARSFSMNCCDATCGPETKIASTCSDFHFSMKASSWDWAADVSALVMVKMAVLPSCTPMFLRPGTTLLLTVVWLVVSPRTPTVLPSRVCWPLSSWKRTESRRSGTAPGKTIMPGGDWFTIAWVSSNVMSTVLWSLATQVSASPDRSMKSPITANTLSSSVNLVHRLSAPVLPIGQNVSYTGTICRPRMPPCLLMSSKYGFHCCSWLTRIWFVYCAMQLKSTRLTPTLMLVAVTPLPSGSVVVGWVGAAAAVVAGAAVVAVECDDELLHEAPRAATTTTNGPNHLRRTAPPLARRLYRP